MDLSIKSKKERKKNHSRRLCLSPGHTISHMHACTVTVYWAFFLPINIFSGKMSSLKIRTILNSVELLMHMMFGLAAHQTQLNFTCALATLDFWRTIFRRCNQYFCCVFSFERKNLIFICYVKRLMEPIVTRSIQILTVAWLQNMNLIIPRATYTLAVVLCMLFFVFLSVCSHVLYDIFIIVCARTAGVCLRQYMCCFFFSFLSLVRSKRQAMCMSVIGTKWREKLKEKNA